MRFFVPVLALLSLFGCPKTTVEHPVQQQAFAAQDVCAQGPFSVSLAAPETKNPALLRLGFAQETIPGKLYYQVKIRGSGKVLASGSLEQKVEPGPNGVIPKNPCLARVMPGPAVAEAPKETAESKSTGEGGYVLVIIPDAREPQMMRLGYQDLPEKNPIADIPLDNIPPGTAFEIIFWSEEPYPLGRARIQASLLEIKKEFVPDPERVQARLDRKEKRAQREAEYALSQETERLEAAKARDEELALQGKEDPERESFFNAQRGKLLIKYRKQWEDALYGKKYSDRGRALIDAKLSVQVYEFLSSRQPQINAFYDWKANKRQEAKDDRRQRRKDAVKRYTKLEATHLKRLERRDGRKEKRQEGLSKESQDYKDLNIKRGKKLVHYNNHFERFEKLMRARTFGKSLPEAYYELDNRERNFMYQRQEQISAYRTWKSNKKYEREEERRQKEMEREKEKLAKKAEKAMKLVSSWRERFEALKADDEKAAKSASGLTGEDKKKSDYKRGKIISQFREKFFNDYDKHAYRSDEALPLWTKLYEEINVFTAAHQEQLYAYDTWKDDKRAARQQERLKRQQERRVEQEKRAEAEKKKQLEKETKKSLQVLASWKERFEGLKSDDEKAAKASEGLSGEDKKLSNVKRGKILVQFRKRFLNDYYDFIHQGNDESISLWNAFQIEVEAFYSARQEQTYAYERYKSDKKQAREDARRKKQEEREQKREKEKLAKKAERTQKKLAKKAENSKEMLATWKERFETLKADDEKAAQKAKDLKGDEKKLSDAKRGKAIVQFRKGFSRSYDKFYRQDYSQWDALYAQVQAFYEAHYQQVYAHENYRRDKRETREAERKLANAERKASEQEQRIARTEKAVKKESKRFERFAAHDAEYAKELEALSADNTEKREALLQAWGKELKDYQKHFDRFRSEVYKGERYTPTASFTELANKVEALYSLRQGTVNDYYVLQQKKDQTRAQAREARKQRFEDRKQARQAAKGGTRRALERWEQAMTEQKALLAKMNELSSDSPEYQKVEKQRRELIEKAIEDLLKAYNKANYEGQQYLSKAHLQAMGLQHNLDETADKGPTPPPPPLYENPGKQPMDGAIWHNGYWKLENNKWNWKPGYWELPPGAVPANQ